MRTVTAYQVFGTGDPVADTTASSHPPWWRELRPQACVRTLIGYYRDPLAWFGLFGTLLIVAYVGGAVMFVLHAVVLGELGPAISPGAHWALDSTLGFVGFAPVAAVLVPLSAWVVAPDPNTPVRAGPYAVVGGVLFAFAAAPGPIAHDLLVGRGTWLANRVTQLLGNPTEHVHTTVQGDGVSQALSIACQFAVGLPTYIMLMWASLAVVRTLVRQRWTVQSVAGPAPAE